MFPDTWHTWLPVDDGPVARAGSDTIECVVGRDRRASAGATGRRTATRASWHEFADAQAGVVARSQLLTTGWTPGQLGAVLDARRWTGLYPGVYATFTGPIPALSRAWAAVLAAGPDAALAGAGALWLWGVLPAPPDRFTVCVPWERRVEAPHDVRVVRRRHLDRLVHPAALPPRLRVEEAVLDVVDAAVRPADVIDVVLRATGSRQTTPVRLAGAQSRRSRLRHRRLLVEMIGESADGVQSALERRFRRTVEQAHGLPRAERNRPEPVLDALGRQVRSRYRDAHYRRWRTVVELDGHVVT